MSIVVVGVNHKTAPVHLREKAYVAVDKLSFYLQDLLAQRCAQEAVLLSTCNRSELYCATNDVKAAIGWFGAQSALTRQELDKAMYVYRDEEAISHMMCVACGLDSMVLGEPQILGQFKEAFSESCAASAVGSVFHRLFRQIFALAKEIRTTTALGACPVSVASAAVQFAKQQVTHFAQAKIALVGAGETAQLVLRYVHNHVKAPISLINRTHKRGLHLVHEVGGNMFGLEGLVPALAHADVVFSATGSAEPIIRYDMMLQALSKRPERPILLIDIAVPRDIEPAVGQLKQVKLYCIDHLRTIIEQNRKGREHAAYQAQEMIRKKSAEVFAELASIDHVAHTIRAYRGQVEDICRNELAKAKQQLGQGADPAHVLDAFAAAYTNKLLHTPSTQLRQAGFEGRLELLKVAKKLFALPDVETEHP